MSDTKVNEPFLREVMAWIKLHPERWNQQRWVNHTPCGTTYCLAGWAYVLGTGRTLTEHSMKGDVIEEAARLLGLTLLQVDRLFYYTTVHEDRGDGIGHARPVTYAELCAKVEEVTGVRVKDEVDAG